MMAGIQATLLHYGVKAKDCAAGRQKVPVTLAGGLSHEKASNFRLTQDSFVLGFHPVLLSQTPADTVQYLEVTFQCHLFMYRILFSIFKLSNEKAVSNLVYK